VGRRFQRRTVHPKNLNLKMQVGWATIPVDTYLNLISGFGNA